jgi:hypothetical protein
MKININSFAFVVLMFVAVNFANTDDGYRLWLKYDLISDVDLLKQYSDKIRVEILDGESATIASYSMQQT